MGWFHDVNQAVQKIGEPTGIPVLGDKTLFNYSRGSYQHVHMPAKCHPSLADAPVFTAGAAKWEESAAQTFIDAGVINEPFDIHFLCVEQAVSVVYEISLWSGAAADTEIARVRTHRSSTPSGTNNVPIQIPPQPAGTKISVKVASNSTNADTIALSAFYHTYVG